MCCRWLLSTPQTPRSRSCLQQLRARVSCSKSASALAAHPLTALPTHSQHSAPTWLRPSTSALKRSTGHPLAALRTDARPQAQVIRVNTSFNEEKLNAFNMLCCYAEELREAFFPYCAEVNLRVGLRFKGSGRGLRARDGS